MSYFYLSTKKSRESLFPCIESGSMPTSVLIRSIDRPAGVFTRGILQPTGGRDKPSLPARRDFTVTGVVCLTRAVLLVFFLPLNENQYG